MLPALPLRELLDVAGDHGLGDPAAPARAPAAGWRRAGDAAGPISADADPPADRAD
jgi:hypothetical protein